MPNNGCHALQASLCYKKADSLIRNLPCVKYCFWYLYNFCYLYFITFENLPQWTKGRQMVDKISTNPLQNIDSLLAEGVASSKYNLKKSKGLGCFPTSRFAQQVQGIYLCTACWFAKPVQVCIACYFCDSISVSCWGFDENRDFGWISGEFCSESG